MTSITRVEGDVNPETGFPISAGSHAYAYDGSSNLTTDTWTYRGVAYVKTYTYNGSNLLTAESVWVAA